MDSKEEGPLWTQSGVNSKGEPFVQLVLGGRIIGQFASSEARQFGMNMIESAEASETDALLLRYLTKRLDLDLNRAGQALIDFRMYRTELTGKKQGATSRTDWTMPEGMTEEKRKRDEEEMKRRFGGDPTRR
jgi:hypothetical protein